MKSKNPTPTRACMISESAQRLKRLALAFRASAVHLVPGQWACPGLYKTPQRVLA